MKPSFVLGIALLALGLSNGAEAQGTSLILPIQPSVMFQHATTGAPLGRAGYFLPGAPPPTWVVAQWGNPSNLLPSSGAATGWQNANATTRVQYYPSMYGYSNVYELAQAGNRCNVEFDLFLSPGNPAFVPGTALGITRSAPLTSIGSLRVDVGTHVYYSVAGTACIQQGYWDYGQFVYSMILNSTNGQVLFYQINLGNTSPSRQALGPISWCPEYESGAQGGSPQFCLDDDIRHLGGTWITPGVNAINSVDFLPRILKVIAAGHTKPGANSGISLDQNPSHWTVGAAYIGQITQGRAVTTSRWYGFGLSSWPGGTFCNGNYAIQWSCTAGRPVGPGWVDQGNGCYHRNSGNACSL